jgi:hypothetical protein
VSVVVVNGFHSASGRGGADGGGQLPHSGGSGLRPLLWGLLLVLGGALAYTTSRRGRRS